MDDRAKDKQLDEDQLRPTPEDIKAENHRKAEVLRAKLLAQRQNTPIKPGPRATHSLVSETFKESPQSAPSVPTPSGNTSQVTKSESRIQNDISSQKSNKMDDASKDNTWKYLSGVDALLAQGKAAADAQAAALGPSTTSQVPPPPKPNKLSSANGVAVSAPKVELSPAQAPVVQQSTETNRLNDLSNAYYEDLPTWLEFTGYHDREYRSSKLRAYKERLTLEKEAARIAQRLEELKRADQGTTRSPSTAAAMPAIHPTPPALPSKMPRETAVIGQIANGSKRKHSPEPSSPSSKNRRYEPSDGFRIRGANDSPDPHYPWTYRQRTPSPRRKSSYSDGRRLSDDEYMHHHDQRRDPSLERRQAYYRKDAEPRYDRYMPRESLASGWSSYTPQPNSARGKSQRGGGNGGRRRGL